MDKQYLSTKQVYFIPQNHEIDPLEDQIYVIIHLELYHISTQDKEQVLYFSPENSTKRYPGYLCERNFTC